VSFYLGEPKFFLNASVKKMSNIKGSAIGLNFLQN